VRAGIDDIVWIAGDISNVQYTRTSAAIPNRFFDGKNRKNRRKSDRKRVLLSCGDILGKFAKFPSAESKF
jgi:hypothetical protein